MKQASSDHDVEFIKMKSLESILQALEQQESLEAKMNLAISAMEQSISNSSAPDFKIFWEMRKLCVEWMREPLSASFRSESWNQIALLSQEARRVKRDMEVESEYTKEQIEMAIQALQKEIEGNFTGEFYLEDMVADLPEFKRNLREYSEKQGALYQLNLWVERLSALRKELMNAELKMRSKNLFFEQLSKLGDHVFPERKQLIKDISHLFEQDVNEYIENRFVKNIYDCPSFQLKEEIKALQYLAKELTLNTIAFTETRLKLSGGWDQLKAFEQDKKEYVAKMRGTFKENCKQLLDALNLVISDWEAKTISVAEVNSKLAELMNKGRNLELGREEVYEWKKAVDVFRNKMEEEEALKESEKKKKEQERALQKKQVFEGWQLKIENLVQKAQNLDLKELMEAQGVLSEEIQSASLTKTEKLQLEKFFNPIKEKIRLKKEAFLSELPEDRLEALQQLRELRRQKQEEKLEIEAMSEKLRKLAGGSGHDFVKAMEYQEKLGDCIERKKNILQSLDEIKEKIDEFSN